MRKFKSLFTLLISVVVFSVFAQVSAFAAFPVDVSRDATVDIVCEVDGVTIKGMEFELYKIADMDADRKLTATADFEHHKTEIETEEESYIVTLGTLFNNFIISEELQPMLKGKTGADGKLTFSVKAGVYLLASKNHIQGDYIYDTTPVVIYVPGYFGGTEWDYGVEVKPKFSKIPVTDVYTDITVVKIWKDTGYEEKRPHEIAITLYRDRDIYDWVLLNEANNWRHTWTLLEKVYDWSVVEEEVDGYKTEIEKDGNTFIVTNNYKKPPKDPELPDTGQNWLPPLVLFTAGITLVIVGVIRRRTGEYEE